MWLDWSDPDLFEQERWEGLMALWLCQMALWVVLKAINQYKTRPIYWTVYCMFWSFISIHECVYIGSMYIQYISLNVFVWVCVGVYEEVVMIQDPIISFCLFWPPTISINLQPDSVPYCLKPQAMTHANVASIFTSSFPPFALWSPPTPYGLVSSCIDHCFLWFLFVWPVTYPPPPFPPAHPIVSLRAKLSAASVNNTTGDCKWFVCLSGCVFSWQSAMPGSEIHLRL